MNIHSFNEWDRLRSIVVGTATNANWPSDDPVFAQENSHTTWTDTPVPSGPVPQWIVEETNQDLEGLCDILTKAGVTVYRPRDLDFPAFGGMYNYCPRDRLLIAGEIIVDTAMMFPCRDTEIEALQDITRLAPVVKMPRDQNLTCDAANICRLGSEWLFLESRSGNRAAAEWLADQFPNIDIYGCNFYSGVHIDSTIVPLREGLVMINAERVKPEWVPAPLRDWEIIWIDDCVAQPFYQYPYASKWIGMNVLSVDPSTVIVSADQTEIIKTLESRQFTVIPHTLRHSRTLGGGFHCVTLDIWRQGQ